VIDVAPALAAEAAEAPVAVAHVRRVRHTMPPKAALAALRVDAAGRVVEGLIGYYWYGDAVVLATDGEHGAEYLLGGASVPLPAIVALAAVADAKRWCRERERPATEVVADDWAARAWALDCHEQDLVEHAARRLGEASAWRLYRAALDAARAALARRP
jgi:hypothetical protein